MGISVVMASYLGEYPGSRSNPIDKFIRAVKSFQNQTHIDKELVIVSDGCEITNGLYTAYFKQDTSIKLVQCEKREHAWPGELREAGRSLAKYDWITYLDSDDIILKDHLKIIENKIKSLHESERLLFNSHYLIPMSENPSKEFNAFIGLDEDQYRDFYNGLEFNNEVEIKMAAAKNIGHTGTWQITHHKHIPTRWMNSNKIGEDSYFIQRLKTIENWQEYRGQYIICHMAVNRKVIWDI